MMRSITVALAIVLLFSSCAKKKRVPVPPASPAVYEETGIASWYGHPYHGRAAASGEIYDMETLTAAHRTLPFGTMVRVQNLENGREVDVRINDRGPFVEGRIIDLSHAAARQIGMLGPGTAKVRLRIVSLPAVTAPGYYAVQVGAFRDRANAESQKKEMERRYGSRYGTAGLVLRDGNPPLWRVLVGRAATIEEATALAGRVKSEGAAAFVVRVDGPEGNL